MSLGHLYITQAQWSLRPDPSIALRKGLKPAIVSENNSLRGVLSKALADFTISGVIEESECGIAYGEEDYPRALVTTWN